MKYLILRIYARLKQYALQFQAWCMCLITWPLSLFCRRRGIWMFRERGTDARDNGYWMFRYMKEQHPEIDSVYAITKDSPDLERLSEWKDSVVTQNSFKHYLLMWKTDCMISTHVGGGFPNKVGGTLPLYKLVKKISPKKIVFLQHGIIKDNLVGLHASNCQFDVFVCGAKPEYDYVKKMYDHPEGVVQYTGLARFDLLHDFVVNPKQILLMPTWRGWLADLRCRFEESEYYLQYKELLTSPELHALLKANDMTLVFYPHHEVQPHIDSFKKLKLPPQVIIASKYEYDVQTLLKESALLITDYSSIFFDFAYMRKPIIYFLFDEERFHKEHHYEGYFDYHDSFGIPTENTAELIQAIKKNIERNFVVEDQYRQRMDSFFPLYDTSNRERIYQAICKL